MAALVTMPKLGLTMNSGSVSEWKKKEGDAVNKGEILFIAATDKLTFDVESPEEGFLLAILVNINEEVSVGSPLAVIGEKGEDYSSLIGVSPELTSRGFIKASPLAKKTARDLGVDISQIHGSGPEGRIVKKDVVAFAESPSAYEKVKASPVAERMAAELGVDLAAIEKQGRIMKEDVMTAVSSLPSRILAEDRCIPLSNMRKVIGERMLLSTTSIPAVSYNMEVDFTL